MGIKITKKMLDDYRKLKREIPILEYELQHMKQGDNGYNNSTVCDYKRGYPRPQAVIGFDKPLYEKRENVLKEKKERTRAVEKWINSIDDGQTRCVFRMYYIDGMIWEKIASSIGYSSSPDYPRLHIRDDYLKKNGIK